MATQDYNEEQILTHYIWDHYRSFFFEQEGLLAFIKDLPLFADILIIKLFCK